MKQRVICYIDGFNLYHALVALGDRKYRWLSLRKLCDIFVQPHQQDIVAIKYFSAYAYWRTDSRWRHEQYVRALENEGVSVILGRFQEKDRRCKLCHEEYKTHEEKESDVNLAVTMIDDAYNDRFDVAMLVTRDSDQKMPVKLIKEQFDNKRVRVIAPPALGGHSKVLAKLVGKKNLASIKQEHLEHCLLPEEIVDPETNKTIALRPKSYGGEES